MNFEKSDELRKKSHACIPGGAHTYSKGDDQFPKLSPGFICKGEGAYVWDVDGNKFIDWGMGLRSTTLGHGYKRVVDAVLEQISFGANFTRPSHLEVEFAELLVNIIPCADMVKFAKNGSTVTTAAVKLSRAYTGRDLVAICADHAFYSYDDWFIGSTVMDAGVPQAIKDLTVKFNYNDIESVENLFKKYPNEISCVILEPATEIEPKNNFLNKLRSLCDAYGVVLIFDEMITGFRWHIKGAQYVYNVFPDLATYGKGIANGFSVGVLAGKKDIMNLGGINGTDHERVFLISTTHGAENHSLAAAIASLRELQEKNVPKYLAKIGASLRKELNDIHKKYDLDSLLHVYGVDCRLALSVNATDMYDMFQVKTYFLQELIGRGILFSGYFSPSFSHTIEHVKKTVEAWDYACLQLKYSLDKKNLEDKLVGPCVKPVFRKYN